MREIKFRIWNKKEKSMGVSFTIQEAFYFSEEASIIPNDFELMQYTGLKDKNGKEIYEGDIIQFEFKGKLETSIIKEHHPLNYCWWMSLPFGKREFEVIGNIYENPELLEETI